MAYPIDRTTFKLWVKQQADENGYGIAPFSGDKKLEAIIDNILAEYSAIYPLLTLGIITISGQYAILPDDWIDGSELNTKLLYALQRGKSPEDVDLEQSGANYGNNSCRFGSSYSSFSSGYGLGSGNTSTQDPIQQGIAHQEMPESSTCVIDGEEKVVFILPAKTFSTGSSYSVRYGAIHKILDLNGDIPKRMTIPKKSLTDVFDMIFERAKKARVFSAIKLNETKGEEKLNIDKYKTENILSRKY